jgi:hypothetical protein
MPAAGVLVPIYLLLISAGLLDTRTGLLLITLLANLPLVVWMLYSYFKEVPLEIVDAARIDGARSATRFVADSPLEGDGFEPSVPQQIRSDLGAAGPSPITVDSFAIRNWKFESISLQQRVTCELGY